MIKKAIMLIKEKEIIKKEKEIIKKNKKIEDDREKYFNSDDYVIMTTLFYNQNKDNSYRIKDLDKL